MNRVARIVGGFALLGAGTVMLVTPGPGILAIAGGLALLSKDMPWAARITDRFKSTEPAPPGSADQAGG